MVQSSCLLLRLDLLLLHHVVSGQFLIIFPFD